MIVCNVGLKFYESTLPVLLIGGVLFLCVCAFHRSSVHYSNRWIFGVVMTTVLFLFGVWRMDSRDREVRVEWNDQKQAYRGWVTGMPQEKTKSRLIPLDVGGKCVWLYLPKDSLSAKLKCGDEIFFYTCIQKPRNWNDSIGFNYAEYLVHQGVSGTAYAGKKYWKKGIRTREPDWKQKALMFRAKLVDRYRQWGFTGNELSVIAALTLGDRSALDADLRNHYSIAGASHVLALSGLHLSIVAGILSALLLLRPHSRRGLWIRGIIILLALWIFAFITGLSGSVVRSSVMFTIIIVGRCLRRDGLLLNSLALAALVMLLYDPFYLWSVGFQMSFLAVAGIAWFMPIFHKCMFASRFRLIRYIQEVIWVSVAAQLGVAPLVVYYFHNFPLYFLFTNLGVIPLAGFILLHSVLLWLSLPFAWLHDLLVQSLQHVLHLLNSFVFWIGNLPGASFHCSCSAIDVLLYYWLILCLLALWHYRTVRPLVFMSVGILSYSFIQVCPLVL